MHSVHGIPNSYKRMIHGSHVLFLGLLAKPQARLHELTTSPLKKKYKTDLRFRKASPAMFKSLSCQRLFRQSFTHKYQTHLPIVGSQTSLKLRPFRHNMSIALRATREDGSGMQRLDLLLRILLIPQWRIFRRRISTDILGIAGCTCVSTRFLGHVC